MTKNQLRLLKMMQDAGPEGLDEEKTDG